MTLQWEADVLVKARSENIGRYKRNFLRQAVCELRFPTLMELGDARPPAVFVSALRKEYPNLELTNELTLGVGGGANGSNNAHVFRSVKLNWSVSLKQSAISLETNSYTGYENMKERVLRVVEAASKIIDSDFFTRVGLRYVNVIDTGEDPVDGWVNPELIAPISSGNFLGIQEYAGKFQLMATDGGCLLQHGIRFKPPSSREKPAPEYVIDIDTFRNEISLKDTEAALDSMHAQAFDFFDWGLGPKSRQYLSKDKSSEKN